MIAFIQGRIIQVALLLIVIALGAVVTYVASRRRVKTRKVEGTELIESSVKEAAELGRPVLFVPGLDWIGAADTLAAMAILRHVAALCVKYGAKIIVANADPTVLQVTEEVVKKTYADAGKSNLYTADSVRFIAGRQFALAAGVMGLIQRDRPAFNVFVGYFTAEALQIAEMGRMVAKTQVGGTSNFDQLPFFLATCDSTLLGGDLYAAEAYFEGSQQKISALVGQDVGKVIAIILILAGSIALTLGTDVFLRLLRT